MIKHASMPVSKGHRKQIKILSEETFCEYLSHSYPMLETLEFLKRLFRSKLSDHSFHREPDDSSEPCHQNCLDLFQEKDDLGLSIFDCRNDVERKVLEESGHYESSTMPDAQRFSSGILICEFFHIHPYQFHRANPSNFLSRFFQHISNIALRAFDYRRFVQAEDVLGSRTLYFRIFEKPSRAYQPLQSGVSKKSCARFYIRDFGFSSYRIHLCISSLSKSNTQEFFERASKIFRTVITFVVSSKEFNMVLIKGQ